MANVLNEFLHGVSKGFQDAAFASFSRRRSTVREDIAQSFAGPMDMSAEQTGEGGSEYIDMIGTTPKTKTTKSKGKKKSSGGDSLKEI